MNLQPCKRMKRKMLLLAAIIGCLAFGRATAANATGDSLRADEQRRFDYYFLESIRQKGQGKLDAAFDLLQHCLSIQPRSAAALYELAQYYVYLKQDSLAVSTMEQARAYAPDNYWYAQGLANLYQQQGSTDKTIALLEEMTRQFPDKLDPLYNLLDLYSRTQAYDQELDALDRLEQRTGKTEELTMEKFRIYLRKKDHKHAFREIESLVKEYPMDTRYQVILGDAYLQNGRKKEAYNLYRQVLDTEPDNAMALYSLANYYQETGQDERYRQQIDTLLMNRRVPSETKLLVMRQLIVENEQAGTDSTRITRLFDRILQQEPDDTQLPLLYVQYLYAKNKQQQALPVLQHVLDTDPTNTAARMTLLGEAIRTENTADVRRLCEGGIVASPERPEFYLYLAIAYNQEERYADVIDLCRKALKQAAEGTKKEVLSDFLTIMGDAHYALKQPSQAYAAYDSALVYYPDNIPALNNYAYYLSLERRDLDRAEEMSYKTIKAEPENPTYLDTYAWILFEKGRYDEARIYIDNALLSEQKDAISAGIVEHAGDIYYMTGDTERALAFWQKAQTMGINNETLKRKISKKKYIPYDNHEDGEKATNAAHPAQP